MIRKIAPDELDRIYPHIDADFPKDEHPPKLVLKKMLRSGRMTGLVFEQPEEKGYALLTRFINGYSLIFLYAVFSGSRGKGIGTQFMNELIGSFSEKKGLILEVERPCDAKTPEEKNTRLRRIEFYKRLGYRLVLEVEYSIYGVPMFLMARPYNGDMPSPEFVQQTICALYDDLCGSIVRKKILHSRLLSADEAIAAN